MSSGIFNTVSKKVTVNGIIDHARLINRHLENQHPISAISGLQEELNNIKVGTGQQVENLITETKNSLTGELNDLDTKFTRNLDNFEKLAENKYSTKADHLALSNTLTTVLLEVDEDMTELQETTASQIAAFKDENNNKFSDLQEELDNRFEEVGTKITTDIQPKLDTLATNISTVETNLSNTSNIYHTKTAEAPAVPLDEVLTELYQGSGNAKNITYTSGEDEKPLNEVIDELYQGSGSAANISYTKDKTVHAAISDLETGLGAAAEEADKQFKTILEYINTLHPLTITISKGSSTTKHFSDSGNISVEWKTNRGIGENTMVFSDTIGSTICTPKNIPTSSAETVTYAHTWSPYNAIKDTLAQASASDRADVQATISIPDLNIEKSISCTYTHYVYCGMLNKPFEDISNLSQSIIDSLSTAANRFLQTTNSLSNKTYKATSGGGYLYYAAPVSYVTGKTLVVDFGIGKTYLDKYSTVVTLQFGGINVDYAVYQITNDLQNGDITAAISVQN